MLSGRLGWFRRPLSGSRNDTRATDPSRRGLFLNSFWNVAAYALPGVYTLWLYSYLIGQVGTSDFGFWVTAQALLAPLSVFDAGLAFVVLAAAATHGLGPHDDSVERAHAATSLYAGLAVAALLVGGLLGLAPQLIFRLDGHQADTSRALVWLLSLDFALVLATSAWTGILRGARRYDLTCVAAVTQVGVSVIGTLALVHGFGLVGAAISQLAGRVASRSVTWLLVRRAAPWYRAIPGRPNFRYLRQVARFSAPLLVINMAGQISFSADVLVVGAMIGPTAAATIAVGARLPALAVAVLQLAVDVFYPRLVAESGAEGAMSGLLATGLRLASFLGSAVFLAMVLAAGSLLTIWVGSADPVAESVMVLYSIAWLIHMPAHVLGMQLVARQRHYAMAPLVLAEGLLNFVLSIILVSRIGAVGAAVASLFAVAMSNGIGLPMLFGRASGLRSRAIGRPVALGLLFGTLVALVSAIPRLVLTGPPLPPLIAQAAIGLGLTAMALPTLVRRHLR